MFILIRKTTKLFKQIYKKTQNKYKKTQKERENKLNICLFQLKNTNLVKKNIKIYIKNTKKHIKFHLKNQKIYIF